MTVSEKWKIFWGGGGVRRILIKSCRKGKYHPLPGKEKVLGTKPVAKFMVPDWTRGYSWLRPRVSTEFRRHGIPSVFFTSVYSAFRAESAKNSAEFRWIPCRIIPWNSAEFHGIPWLFPCMEFRISPKRYILGAAWLNRVQRGSIGYSVAQLGCSMAQLVVRWPAVWQARVQIPARHPREVFPSERNKQWRKEIEASANGYEYMYCMNVIMNVWKR
jgi:hypothetical protein